MGGNADLGGGPGAPSSDAVAFPLDDYLARIGYSGPLRATPETLEGVQRAQLATVPFENFDVLLGRPVSLEPAALIAKILHGRRGGYCFELNGLLLEALRAIGFDARPLLARVHLSGTPSGRSHELLLVTIAQRPWIADAGFGGPALRAPMPLALGEIHEQDGQAYRLVDAGELGAMLQMRVEDGWRDLYSFDLGRVWPADIELGHHFTSTHPSSFFTFSRVAALHTSRGRVSLLDRTLRTLEDGRETVTRLEDGAPYLAALERHFGIVLEAACGELPPIGTTS